MTKTLKKRQNSVTFYDVKYNYPFLGINDMYIINKIQTAIDYIEAHLKEDISKDLISYLIGISGPDIENAFKVLTGYTLAEYIRNRRLSEAALDIKNSSRSMVNISLDYRYNSTASFARAFSRFHGYTAS